MIGAASISSRRHEIARARTEDERYLDTVARWVSGDISARFGSLLLSDPSCLGAVHVTGAYSEERVLIRDICTKGVAGGKLGAILVEAIDYGYPYHVKPRENNHLTGRFESVNGYPIPVFTSTHDGGTLNQTARSRLFAWDGVFYLVTETQGIYSQRMNGWVHDTLGSNDCDATIEMVGSQEIICVHDNVSDLWLAIASTPQSEIAINTSVVPVESPISRQDTPITGDDIYYGFGYEPLSYGSNETLICFTIGVSKADVLAKVDQGLLNGWKEPYSQVKAYWGSYFEGLRDKWLNLPVEFRVKGYMALMQLAVSTWNADGQGAFLGAGPGTWYGNYLRDTGFVIAAVAKVKPSLAGELLDWFANVAAEPIYGVNSYGIDGLEPGTYNNTDNAATWLWAVGRYYGATGDAARMVALQSQLNSALQYAQNNFVAGDGHINALHSHDFADDAYAPLPTSEIKYESMIDILWISALETIKPVFDALGDSVRATFCSQTAAALRADLSDFVVSDGRMAHSIKPDGSLQDAAWWFPTYLYGAWLLGDETCWRWCSESVKVLGVRNVPLNYGLTISAIPGDQVRIESWGPFLGIVALLAAQHGDYTPASFVASAFPSGSFPEFWYMEMSTDSKPSHYSHATNFPWSYASVLELIQGLSELSSD